LAPAKCVRLRNLPRDSIASPLQCQECYLSAE
jgi:hypothetical protein